ncbi:hypothetical protein FT663_02893 [Candidozyma haemuli var. vulneris]|nr:hypothetical protein FT662_02961 [[Candida] haemuloni var. vulneris]KAF3991108.1 hypothetical protein FT663_02893 [[Candida] haemuloni var. vulneris]
MDDPNVTQQLRSVIVHSLDTFNYKNAEFAAEHLVALNPQDPESLFLYALVLYRQSKYKSAFNRTSSELAHGHLGCSYIYARSCLHLGKYKEGIYTLVGVSPLYNETANAETKPQGSPWNQSPEPESSAAYFASSRQRHAYEAHRHLYPDSSAVYHLLGDLYKAEGDTTKSALNYSTALKYNVFDFEAFQELARSGADVRVKAIYKPNQRRSSPSPVLEPKSTNTNDSAGISNPFATPRLAKNVDVSTPRILSASIPDAPLRKPQNDEFTKPPAPISASSLQQVPQIQVPPSQGPKKHHFPKRSSLAPPSAQTRQGLKRTSSQGFMTESRSPSQSDVDAADITLRKLFSTLAKAYKCFCKYDCYKAIRLLESLPENIKDTPWALSKLGRLHYEIVNYKQSRRFFIRLRQSDRTRLEDMEYYSTLLWHLQKNVELTYLANEVHDIDSSSPITWCVMGNLFSLTREPDEAIKCFDKAIKIDPQFTYAHTLKGHEYYSNDNYEKALDCFRLSLLMDSRHYNALYGIGMVYINLGELQKAAFHFKKAVAINPINVILICCVGMVLEKLGKKSLALKQYDLASKLQPLSALPIFKKASLLFSLQQFDKALEQFELVKELAPNEASVHFLLAQLYNIQNDKYSAIREFTIALNLDPKGNYLIREAMEMLKET